MTGVDLVAQPRYPFDFHQGDALAYLAAHAGEFDAVHASPPCQFYSATRHLHPGADHPDLVDATRAALQRTGLPWIIENVPGAPLRDPLTLCGSMFGLTVRCRDGVTRQLRRHRLFESPAAMMLPTECDHRGQPVGVYGKGGGGAMTRGYKATLADARAVMGTPWMNRAEVSQAIPPAYAEYLGQWLLDAMRHAAPGPTSPVRARVAASLPVPKRNAGPLPGARATSH